MPTSISRVTALFPAPPTPTTNILALTDSKMSANSSSVIADFAIRFDFPVGVSFRVPVELSTSSRSGCITHTSNFYNHGCIIGTKTTVLYL